LEVTGNINAKYQDVAEWVESSQKPEAGTVVALDPERSNQVLTSSEAYDTKVAGVVSAQPGISLGERGEGKVLVATTGRVKVKVDASHTPIKIGDLLVTSDVAGMAMKSEPVSIGGRRMHAPGTLIGKALEPLAKGTGEILVLLSLQ
jgi:co-chaperonin GroES (HSP10)